MKRITKISLRNFRAFEDEHETTVELPVGENLLIYGENGSGKTSLYSALLGFLESAGNSKYRFTPNLYAKKNAENFVQPGYVRISFTEVPISNASITKTYQFGPAEIDDNVLPTYNVSFLRKANQARGFLSYREIVRTYLSADVRDENQLDDSEDKAKLKKSKRTNAIFNLLIATLLAHHKLDTANRTVAEELDELYDFIERKSNSWMFLKANSRLENPFDPNSAEKDLIRLVKKIEAELNRYLKDYFNNGLQLQFNTFFRRKSSNNWNRELQAELHIQAYLGGTPFAEDYTDFLNEARLSSLAVCFYLAAIRTNPQPDEFKFLFLDDIFIGLDTSNRLPLLQLLHKEFVINDYQLVLTTYDREWFELAANWFAKKSSGDGWKKLEMYEDKAEDSDGGNFKPVLINSSDEYEMAEKYFKAKDYAAAGNYLRKALEKVTKKLAPYESGEYEVDARDKGNSVDARFERLKLLRKRCGVRLSEDLLADILLYQQLVLHPSSHYNTTHTLYREELKITFRLVKALREEKTVRLVRLLKANEVLRYESSDNNTYGHYWSECVLTNDLLVVLEDGAFLKSLPCSTRTLQWEWNGYRFSKDGTVTTYTQEEIEGICSTERELAKRPTVIEHTLRPYVKGVKLMQDFIQVTGKQTLMELMEQRQLGFPMLVQEV